MYSPGPSGAETPCHSYMKWKDVFSQVKDTHHRNILTGGSVDEGNGLKGAHAGRLFELGRKLM